MPLYPSVDPAKILEFFEAKGFAPPVGEPFSFSNPDEPPSSIVSADEEFNAIDLNHLVEDWTVQGEGELAREFIIWLGMDPIV